MKLRDLLELTSLNSIIKIEGINSDRIKTDLTVIECLNKYNQIESKSCDDAISQYGEYTVLRQSVEKNCLIILIKV